jgi:hypothetical protein
VNSRLKFISTVLIILACLLIAGAAFADPATPADNNPATNPDANACYAGGSYENRCLVDIDLDGTIEDWEIDAMWEAGWYRIRLEYGMISPNQVPPQYSFIVPDAPAAATCTMTLTPIAARYYGVSSIVVPIDVINGSVDPNAWYGTTTPYGFDWYNNGLSVYFKYFGSLIVYGNTFSGDFASTDCPTPTPPVTR